MGLKPPAPFLSPYSMPILVFHVSHSLSPRALTSLKCYHPTIPEVPEAQGGKVPCSRSHISEMAELESNPGPHDFTAGALRWCDSVPASICFTSNVDLAPCSFGLSLHLGSPSSTEEGRGDSISLLYMSRGLECRPQGHGPRKQWR